MLTEYSKVYSPVYHDLVEITKDHERVHWTESEVKMGADVEQWKQGKITAKEKDLISNILRLFTASDVAVGSNYYDRIIPVIKNNEARNMLGSFAGREGTHQRAYALLSDTLGFGEDFHWEFFQYHEMVEKYEYMVSQTDDTHAGFASFLAKQTLVEGVNLFASFAILLNFDRLGKLPGMCDVVRWSQIDEGIHLQGNTTLFRIFLDEHPEIVTEDFKREIYLCAQRLVELEDAFIDKAFELGGMDNVSKDDIKLYVRYVTDYRMNQLGFKKNWNIKVHPIPWIDALMGKTFGSFFEREISEYAKDNLSGSFAGAYNQEG